jgi:hypothetical protein
VYRPRQALGYLPLLGALLLSFLLALRHCRAQWGEHASPGLEAR